MERWREVYNDWYNEYEELKTKRRVKDVGVPKAYYSLAKAKT